MDLQETELCEHTQKQTDQTNARWDECKYKAAPARACAETGPCAFKFHDPLFTAGAGCQGVLKHAASNNWYCKVNVRRMAKDGSIPPPASKLASVSWLHSSESDTSSAFVLLAVLVFERSTSDVEGRQVFDRRKVL